MAGERHAIDVCAALFGTGFFFSSWVTERKPRFVLLYALVWLAATGALLLALQQYALPIVSNMAGLIPRNISPFTASGPPIGAWQVGTIGGVRGNTVDGVGRVYVAGSSLRVIIWYVP